MRSLSGNGVSYGYTRKGKLATRTWARAGGTLVTTYSYDPNTADRLGVDYSDATPDVSFTYNRLGQITTVTDAVGTRTLDYNATLQLDTEDIAAGGTGLYSKLVTRKYDALARDGGFSIGTAIDPDADYDAGYFYDGYGRFNRVTGPGLPAYGAHSYYAANSDIPYVTYLRPTSSSYSAFLYYPLLGDRDLPSAAHHYKVDVGWFVNYWYYYDGLARRYRISRTGLPFTEYRYYLYAYNDRSELIDSNTPYANDEHLQYAYDDIGNRETFTLNAGTPTSYTKNNLNQYTATAAPAETFSYDLDGNLTQDGTRTYAWDGENRLIAIEPSAPVEGDRKLEFAYDYMGRRVQKKVLTRTGGVWSLTSDLRFVYDGWNMVLELDGLNSNATLRKFTWGLDLSRSLHGAGGVGGLRGIRGETQSKDYWVFSDANGNVTQLLDGSDLSIAAHYEYDPYGDELVSDGPYAAANPYRFSTKYLDAETDLYYYGYRYYSPRLGRWLNRDPLEELGAFNLYLSLSNDAINKIDPLGERVITRETRRYYYLDVYRTVYVFPFSFPEVFDYSVWLRKPKWTDAEVEALRLEIERGIALRKIHAGSQFAYEAGNAFVVAAEIGAGILSEPVDWYLTIRDVVRNGFTVYHAMAVLPLVPGAAGRAGAKVAWRQIPDQVTLPDAGSALDLATRFLDDYEEIQPGVFRNKRPSKSGCYHQVRITEHEVTGNHLNFELWTPRPNRPGRWKRLGNKHVYFTNP